MLDNINKKLTLPILVALYWQYFHGGQFLLFKKTKKPTTKARSSPPKVQVVVRLVTTKAQTFNINFKLARFACRSLFNLFFGYKTRNKPWVNYSLF